MSTKHTPGPWRVEETDDSGQAIVRGEYIEICTCWHHSVGLVEQEMWANARLIAAAPELLEAVKDAHDWLAAFRDPPPEMQETLTKLRKTLVKATGEPSQ